MNYRNTQMPTLAERCRLIELLVLDVDGVLTDGSIIYSSAGDEVKAFHVRDGSGLKFWRDAGKQAAIISGRSSTTVDRRTEELGIKFVVQGSGDKLASLRSILKTTNLQAEQVAAVGDDVPDLAMLQPVGLAIAVADACSEVREEAHYVTRVGGGRGAVREAIELISAARENGNGRWNTTACLLNTKPQAA